VGELRYTPWGEERSGFAGFNTDRTYTGQRRESFGLLDYIARYYDPQLGRFIFADTIVPSPGDLSKQAKLFSTTSPRFTEALSWYQSVSP
jgi:RHS repeat-associated protein